MSDYIEAPEGIELGMKVYATTENREVDACIGLEGFPKLSAFKSGIDLNGLVSLPDLGSPWRLMTKEEIAEYKRQQREEEQRERAIERGDDLEPLDDYASEWGKQ